ncbi:MAG: Rid family detoxifying hydrolase [Flavobacteriales bacterium]|jgi:2-iminobutanoate/2-iminopropanoate deaminase|nr:Rid family detoxifying hydrolase [Flavobacteriales bacterium]
MKKVINYKNAPAPIGPYSQAILKNDTLYASGQIAINPSTNELVLTSIEAETTQVMENVKRVLEAANMDFSNLVKCSIFLSDMANFDAVNKVYASYFTDLPPARETVAVLGLPKNVNVEISFIAVHH